AVGDALMAVVGLAVAAIPEGLPATMTIALAIGVQRMASRNAIIRRLPAVETLGSVSVICSDKTGTLTRNEMTVRKVVTAANAYEVTGVGYAPKGNLRANDCDLDAVEEPGLVELVRAALLCNDAELRHADDWRVDGDPMEGALVVLGIKAGFEPAAVRKECPRVDEIPFDAAHRFMATLHHDHSGRAFVLIKGAPERVIEMCRTESTSAGDRPIDTRAWHRRADELASEGHRVLALAARSFDLQRTAMTFADVEDEATLLGLVGLIDPPRAEAVAAISDCRSAGIRVVMITGDHAVTAGEIARQLGLDEQPHVLTGHDLQQVDDQTLADVVRRTGVFARTTPEHKLRLVQALQSNGLTVAMTGDGVNDAPALKRADIGVAMGQKGTEVAKQAAEMVLADDNFA
ncbi:MAG TPA: HAD-IC family P-type ATPase, partial [Steroidobacteraceae bacterium]|nr:HAD-IC family P-type ATPase [Steroidobacteraceae bacterium]